MGALGSIQGEMNWKFCTVSTWNVPTAADHQTKMSLLQHLSSPHGADLMKSMNISAKHTVVPEMIAGWDEGWYVKYGNM